MTSAAAAPDYRVTAPEDRYCDLIMKGGIASGIVYPLAIDELAKHYHFRSIGGTSAGAVAAVVTAAAEYRRRTQKSMAGFDLLKDIPHDLRGTVDGDNLRLKYLFQPERGCRRLFHVLLRSLNHASAVGIAAAAVAGFLEAYWPATLGGLLLGIVGYALYVSGAGPLLGILAGLLIALVAAVAFIAVWVYFDITRNVVDNGYGLCRGTTEPPNEVEAITPWLHGLIQTAAGRKVDGDPLTFGDLWKAPGFPPRTLPIEIEPPPRSIELNVFTTNLAHGRPYLFPHSDERARLFYQSEELSRYVPASVMNWIDDHAAPYEPLKDEDPAPEVLASQGLRQIPVADDFPVLLAARMSLSFPLLFSAVPLYAIDYEPPKLKDRKFRRCWFSDGGIASNFPMHLFDGFLPAWPTFGIDLEAMLPDRPDVFLPRRYLEGSADRWDRFDQEPTLPGKFGCFLLSVVAAMQNWNDNTHARMPGVRDRVARVRLNDDEGGFNLDMPGEVQERVAKRGERAGQELVDRFVPQAGAKSSPGWDEQRWVRLDVLVRTLQKRMPGVELALRSSVPNTTSYADLVAASEASAMPGHDDPLTDDEAKALHRLLSLMQSTAAEMEQETATYSPKPIPDPELRVRPPL